MLTLRVSTSAHAHESTHSHVSLRVQHVHTTLRDFDALILY